MIHHLLRHPHSHSLTYNILPSVRVYRAAKSILPMKASIKNVFMSACAPTKTLHQHQIRIQYIEYERCTVLVLVLSSCCLSSQHVKHYNIHISELNEDGKGNVATRTNIAISEPGGNNNNNRRIASEAQLLSLRRSLECRNMVKEQHRGRGVLGAARTVSSFGRVEFCLLCILLSLPLAL